MFQLDRQIAHKILVTELGYKPHAADLYLDRYPQLDDQFAYAVNAWLENRRIMELSIDGVTIQQVMRAHNTHFLNAIKSLNDLATRPLDAKQREELKGFLVTPLVRR